LSSLTFITFNWRSLNWFALMSSTTTRKHFRPFDHFTWPRALLCIRCLHYKAASTSHAISPRVSHCHIIETISASRDAPPCSVVVTLNFLTIGLLIELTIKHTLGHWSRVALLWGTVRYCSWVGRISFLLKAFHIKFIY